MYSKEELKHLLPQEVDMELKKARLELYKLRLSQANNQLKEVHKLKLYRKYIARLHAMKRYLMMEAVKKASKQ